MAGEKILIIEDDDDILSANSDLLQLAGYRVVAARTLVSGRQAVSRDDPDLIILDILLPDGNGLDLCEELREGSDVRILFLSALNTPEDVIEGLRRGGDDYLGKPYMTEELLLRVKALLRREMKSASAEVRQDGPLEWHPLSHQVFADGTDLLLKPREYAVLELLCENRGCFLLPDRIYRAVWNSEPIGDVHSIYNHMSSLRSKLEPYGVHIEAKRGLGYRITW